MCDVDPEIASYFRNGHHFSAFAKSLKRLAGDFGVSLSAQP
jgi:hypothetical protein